MNDHARHSLVDALVSMFEKSGATIERRADVIAIVGEHRGDTYATTFTMTSPMGTHKVTVEEVEGGNDVSS